jgi:protein TonB
MKPLEAALFVLLAGAAHVAALTVIDLPGAAPGTPDAAATAPGVTVVASADHAALARLWTTPPAPETDIHTPDDPALPDTGVSRPPDPPQDAPPMTHTAALALPQAPLARDRAPEPVLAPSPRSAGQAAPQALPAPDGASVNSDAPFAPTTADTAPRHPAPPQPSTPKRPEPPRIDSRLPALRGMATAAPQALALPEPVALPAAPATERTQAATAAAPPLATPAAPAAPAPDRAPPQPSTPERPEPPRIDDSDLPALPALSRPEPDLPGSSSALAPLVAPRPVARPGDLASVPRAAPPAPEPKPAPPRATKPAAKTATKPAAKPAAEASKDAAKAGSAETAGTAGSGKEALGKWQSSIASALARAHRPPRTTATGRVTLQITVTPGGQLASVGILRSSGQDVLDKAALANVRRARLPKAPKGQSQTATVRFTYAFGG